MFLKSVDEQRMFLHGQQEVNWFSQVRKTIRTELFLACEQGHLFGLACSGTKNRRSQQEDWGKEKWACMRANDFLTQPLTRF